MKPGPLFDRCAGHYDAWYATEQGRAVDEVEARLVEAVFTPAGRDVLEVGCGTGLYTERLVARGHRVTAVDPSPAMIDRARLRLAGRAGDVSFLEGDIATVLPRLGSFHGILSVTAFEFVPAPERVVPRLIDHLVPGGCLVIAVIAGETPWSDAYASIARERPDSVYVQARFPTADEIGRWAEPLKPELRGAIFFPPDVSSYAQAKALEAAREGVPGFLAARWMR